MALRMFFFTKTLQIYLIIKFYRKKFPFSFFNSKMGWDNSEINWKDLNFVKFSNHLQTFLQHQDNVCQNHRAVFTSKWYAKASYCCYAHHASKNVSVLSLADYNRLLQQKILFPIFGQICKTCLRRAFPLPGTSHQNFSDESKDKDPSYSIPKEPVSINMAEKLASRRSLMEFTDSLSISPLKYQITGTNVNDLVVSTKYLLKRKVLEAENGTRKKMCTLIAPNQGSNLQAVLFPDKNKDLLCPEELEGILELYKCTKGSLKLAILSQVPLCYTRQSVSKIFDCKESYINRARALKNYSERYVPPVKIVRNRSNEEKLSHFINFLENSGSLQELAYGAKMYTYSTGESHIGNNFNAETVFIRFLWHLF